MASKREHEADIERTIERFTAGTTRVLQTLVAGLKPIAEATAAFFRAFVANRRIRYAIEAQRWSKAGWYIADHCRRSEARTLRVGAGGVVGVVETAEGGRT